MFMKNRNLVIPLNPLRNQAKADILPSKSVEDERHLVMHAILLKKKTISQTEKRAMLSFLQWQTIVAILLIAISALMFDGGVARSVFFGASVVLLPNIVLAVYIFVRAAERTAQQVVRACYIGEVIKLGLIAGMMIFILRTFTVQMGSFLIGLIGTYLVYVFSPVILKKNRC